MSEGFVNVSIQTQQNELLDIGIEQLTTELEEAGIVGWEPKEASLVIIILSIAAMMAANAATAAATAPPAIFRKYGTELFNIPFNEGASSTASTKWTLLEEGGEYAAHTIPAGTQLEISGLAFYVEKETPVAKGESEVTLQVAAAERGTEYNGLTGAMQLVNSLNYVSTIVIVGESSGGTNQETDEEYLDRLKSLLELQAPRPITASNFAQFALDVPSTILPTGVVVGRATAIDGYNPHGTVFGATPTSGSLSLTEVTSFTGISSESKALPQLHPGSTLEGTGIPTGTTAVAKTGASTLEMSAKATASPGKEQITAVGSYENQRCVTVFVTDKQGHPLSESAREALATYVAEFRELNFLTFIEPASYNEIFITAEIHVLPGFVAESVIANVRTALESFLSPEKWANPEAGSSGTAWLNATQGFNVVRYNTIIGVIESVRGVSYVPAGSAGLKIGTTAAPSGTTDVTMVGPAPLPGTIGGTNLSPSNFVITAV